MDIVICVDGTWNSEHEPGSVENTNVVRLSRLLNESGHPAEYLAGVGAEYDEPDYGDWAHRAERIPASWRSGLAGATGFGTGIRIKKAYKTLCDVYAKGNNRIFLFGFSRGAFAIRALVGFVDVVGLLLSDEARIEHVELAYLLYLTGRDPQHSELRDFLYQVAGTRAPGEDRQLRVYFVGVWDTVASLGVPGSLGELSNVSLADLRGLLPANVAHGRHALSLHDLRSPFAPVLWRGTHPGNPGQTLKQVWFSGDHCDVGGSHADRQLSDRTLEWMLAEAREAGLSINVPVPARAASDAAARSGLEGWFKLAPPRVRYHLKQWPSFTPSVLDSWLIDASALNRLIAPAGPPYSDARWHVTRALRKVDVLTLRLHFELCYREEPSAALPRRPRWLRRVTLKEVRRAVSTVRGRLENLVSDQPASAFERAFVIWALLDRGAALKEVHSAIAQWTDQVLPQCDLRNLEHLKMINGRMRDWRSIADTVRQAAKDLPAAWRHDVTDLADKIDGILAAVGGTPIGKAAHYTLFEDINAIQVVLKARGPTSAT
jgi:uncharacterized protein (DUF2235 family)